MTQKRMPTLAASATNLRRIKSTLAKRIAAADPPQPFERAADRAVLLHGANIVMTAGRLKPALTAKKRAQKDLVQPHTADQHRGNCCTNPADHCAHAEPSAERS